MIVTAGIELRLELAQFYRHWVNGILMECDSQITFHKFSLHNFSIPLSSIPKNQLLIPDYGRGIWL